MINEKIQTLQIIIEYLLEYEFRIIAIDLTIKSFELINAKMFT